MGRGLDMEDTLKSLMINGYQILLGSDGNFVVKKNAVPGNSLELEAVSFGNYGEALDFAAGHFSTPPRVEWSVLARFDRGLGTEYRNLRPVEAVSQAEAENLARMQVDQELSGCVVKEVRVRPKK